MEIIMIDGKVFSRLTQAVNDLLERSKKLTPKKRVDEEWYDNKEVAQLLKVSLRTLQSYRDKGILPYSQIGHKCYYKVKDIERFMEELKSETNK